jgi:NTP pyrophosphatase (non-canonical NTP hydrolase)
MTTYKLAIKTYGLETQLRQTQEECAELITSISHSIRGRKSVRSIAEEVADMEIMLGQLRTVIGPEIVRWKKLKLHRLRQRLGIESPPSGVRSSRVYICPAGCPDRVRVQEPAQAGEYTDDVLEIACPRCQARMVPCPQFETE